MADTQLTCYDCLHCDVCSGIYALSFHCSDVSKCKFFKNKADVVKVVRCEDCIHREVHPDGENAYYLTCNLKWGLSGTVAIEDYCSYGRRKDGRKW
jgi:hypothetical protein